MNRYQWTPDLISFSADPAQTTLSTTYHLLRLFSGTRATATLPLAGPAAPEFGPAYYVAGVNEVRGTRVMKGAVYNATESVPFAVAFEGVAEGARATLTLLTGTAGPEGSNVFAGEETVRTDVRTVTAGEGGVFAFEAPDLSIFVLETVAG